MGGLGKSLNLGAIGKSFMQTRKKSFDNLATQLQDDEPIMDEKLKRQENAQAEVQTSIKERASRISRMLFVYAREHLVCVHKIISLVYTQENVLCIHSRISCVYT